MTAATFDGMIIEATGCAPEDVRDIEDLMRADHRPLGELTRRQFVSLARRAFRALPEYRAVMS